MPIPITGPVHPVNRLTNRGRTWLFLGLLSTVVVTCATWEHVSKSASSLPGLTDVSGPSPRAAESLAFGLRSAQVERGSDSGVAVAALNPNRADAAPAVMVEEYTYSDLRVNIGLSDLDFDATNGNYSFGRCRGRGLLAPAPGWAVLADAALASHAEHRQAVPRIPGP